MARKLRIQFPGGIYHVAFRGNARQDIFGDDADRIRLGVRIAESVNDLGVRVYLYCWMQNHGHLLVETPAGNLSTFMSSVLTGYTVYFNRRHERVGHLMQGRFMSQVVAGDTYLLRLSRYIHLNPVTVAQWKHKPIEERITELRKYRWSSYRAYAGLAPSEDWVSYAPLWALIPGRGSAKGRYRRYVEAGLWQPDELFSEEMAKSVIAVGTLEFRQQMAREHEQQIGRQGKREDVSLRHIHVGEPVNEVLEELSAKLGVAKEEFMRKRRDGTPRGVAALALIRRCGLSERAVAGHLGIGSGSAVSYLVRTVKRRALDDSTLAEKIAAVASPRLVNSHFQG